MSSKEQSLVNAQTSVNRAVFAMNMKNQENPHGANCSDEYIAACITSAISELTFSKNEYERQKDMFSTNEENSE